MNQSREYELDINEMDHNKGIMEKLHLMRNNRENTDFIISVGEKIIHVNKDIVRAGSDYFDAMLSHDTIEKQHGIVHMKGVKYFAVEKCVDFVYTGKLSVSVEQCDDVLFVANMMQLHEIRGKVSLFLQTHVDIKSFFDIKRIALKYSLTSLDGFCDQFGVSKLIALSKLEEFNNIDASYLNLFISSTRSAITGMENAKLAVVVQWVNAIKDDRETTFTELLESIDFSKLTREYCMYLANEEPLFQVSANLARLPFPKVASNDKVSHSSPFKMLHGEESLCNTLIFFVGGLERVVAYFPSDGSSKVLADYHSSMIESDFVACSAGNTLYVFFDDRNMIYLDFDNAMWKRGPPLCQSHGVFLRCAVHQGYIYVGGRDTLEKLNLSGFSEWENIDLKGNTCHSSAIVGYKSSIYLIGGVDDYGNSTRTVMRKSPPTRWNPASSMHFERDNASAVVHDGGIYVCGGAVGGIGISYPHQFEIYSDETDLWIIQKFNNIPTNIPLLGLYDVDGQVILITEDIMKSYDFKDKFWYDVGGFEMTLISWRETTSAYLPRPILELQGAYS